MLTNTLTRAAVALAWVALFLSCAEHSPDSRPPANDDINSSASSDALIDTVSGSIIGRVVFAGKPPTPQKLLVVKDVDVCGKRDHLDERLLIGEDNGIRNAVITVENIDRPSRFDTTKNPAQLDQIGCAYQPHILPVGVDQSIEVLNSDGVLHNVHTFSSRNPPLNLAHPRHLKALRLKFQEPERIAVKCDVHGWMSAWILVFDHPYYAVADERGGFEIAGIPPGAYTLKCWQEMLGEQIMEVNVAPGMKTSVEFRYSLPEASD